MKTSISQGFPPEKFGDFAPPSIAAASVQDGFPSQDQNEAPKPAVTIDVPTAQATVVAPQPPNPVTTPGIA